MIPKELSAELVRSATLGSGSPVPNDTPSELPDLKLFAVKNIPTIRYIPVKFRMPWSGNITSTIDDCVSNTYCVDNWKKIFAVSNCFCVVTTEGKKH